MSKKENATPVAEQKKEKVMTKYDLCDKSVTDKFICDYKSPKKIKKADVDEIVAILKKML